MERRGSGDKAVRLISLFVSLFLFWLALSGHYEALIIGFGIFSCAVVAWLAHRMDVADHEGHPIHLGLAALTYWPWLAWQILKSAVDVTRLILHPALPIDPRIERLPATQTGAVGHATYANSITLTPGTVTLELGAGTIEVHALNRELMDDLKTGEMDAKTTRMAQGS